MSRFVFGTVQLGIQYGVANSSGKPTLSHSKWMLDTAIDGGVSLIDTASAYGDSESVIGQSLDKNKKKQLSIVTKLDPLSGLMSDASISSVIYQVDASVYNSLANLAIAKIDTLLLHREVHLSQFCGALLDRLCFT